MLSSRMTRPITKQQLAARVLIVTLVFLSWIGLSMGSVKIPLTILLQILSGNDGSLPEYLTTIVWNVRMPRIFMAVLIGCMLASSGTVVQAVFHNPLADPYIIGISASAVAGAVLAFLLDLPVVFYGIFAFCISVATTFMIFRLAMGRGAVKITTLLIIGVAASSFLGAFTSFAMYAVGEDSYKIIIWTMGYLGSASWLKAAMLVPPLFAALLFFCFHRHDLDALMLGDQEAHALGIDVGKLKKQLLVVSCLIVSFSVAFSGMIGFVGLIIPHTMRLLIGHSNTKLLGMTSLAGGVFLLFADTIARNLLAPVEIPIGTVTAFFGAPFFIYLAIRSKGGITP
ncbi:iron ABC transporter permease [Marispirochaeta sp.]|uniref:FecCD family ABC transporter permease n=1 Tax=Marispirochaeta sp. TaxID=2038653 RepID=UPI0029C81338|nr:iron ABC transporter permease [Marispirochaeta sp.]